MTKLLNKIDSFEIFIMGVFGVVAFIELSNYYLNLFIK